MATVPATVPTTLEARRAAFTHLAPLMTSATDTWNTPMWLWRKIVGFYGGALDLDPCADVGETIPALHHEHTRGLDIPWGRRVYVNPPYGRVLAKWVAKAVSEPLAPVGAPDGLWELIGLVPGRPDNRWWRTLYAPHISICLLYGRLHFSESTTGAPFPSALFYRGLDPERHRAFARHFQADGMAVQPVLALLERYWRDKGMP